MIKAKNNVREDERYKESGLVDRYSVDQSSEVIENGVKEILVQFTTSFYR